MCGFHVRGRVCSGKYDKTSGELIGRKARGDPWTRLVIIYSYGTGPSIKSFNRSSLAPTRQKKNNGEREKMQEPPFVTVAVCLPIRCKLMAATVSALGYGFLWISWNQMPKTSGK